ncbi:Maleylpyruvate isomerase [Sphingomonas haloaromaticamans]|uniref:Maleylpyruvate isomerase n=2 Tax=Edaphosphingomonas haloaromaticamans TaxID=653954 RepID=A0A1S1H8P9_9SPHN|nr:Maleylpyruvate isomerase [Sphingomonas haloaromaticamans]
MNGMPGYDGNPVRLHDYYRSSAAYRVRIALNLKGIAFESVPVNLLAGEQRGLAFRAINPQGLVPLLEMDGIRIGQSLAIIDYLDARVPDPAFVPRDPAARARQLALALVVACDIHPINNVRVLRYLGGELGADEPAREAWIGHWVREGFAALEAMAAQDGAGTAARPYLGGAAPGIADICLVPQMYNARRFKVALDDFPLLVRIDAALAALPAFAAAHPDRFAPEG